MARRNDPKKIGQPEQLSFDFSSSNQDEDPIENKPEDLGDKLSEDPIENKPKDTGDRLSEDPIENKPEDLIERVSHAKALIPDKLTEGIVKLFSMRVPSYRHGDKDYENKNYDDKDHGDHLNLRIARGIFRGIYQLENKNLSNIFGSPKAVLDELPLPMIFAMYYGVDQLKEIGANELGGLSLGKLVNRLADEGYRATQDDTHAANAICKMQNNGIGTRGYDPNTIEQRLDNLSDDISIQFMMSFFQKRLYSNEERVEGYDFEDPIYNRSHNKKGFLVDKKKTREAYIREAIGLLNEKYARDDDFKQGNIKAWLVPSNTDQKKSYLVQRITRGTVVKTEKEGWKPKQEISWGCNCPYQLYHPNDECSHIKYQKDEYAKEIARQDPGKRSS